MSVELPAFPSFSWLSWVCQAKYRGNIFKSATTDSYQISTIRDHPPILSDDKQTLQLKHYFKSDASETSWIMLDYEKGLGAGIAQRYSAGLGAGWSGVRVPIGAGNFSPHHPVQTCTRALTASYPMYIWGSFPGGKAAEAWGWPLNYTFTSPVTLHGMVLS
jgi:hypothetical protein